MFGFLQRGLAAIFSVALFGFALLLVMKLEPVSAGGWTLRIGLVIAAALGALLIYRAFSPGRRTGEPIPDRRGAGIAMGAGVTSRRGRGDEADDIDDDFGVD